MPRSKYLQPLLYKNLQPSHYEQIRNMYYAYATLQEIRDALSLSSRTLRQALADMGIQTQRKNRYTLNEDYFAEIDSENKAYLLGLLAADGCITEKNYIAIQLVDKEPLDLFVAEIELSLKPRKIKKYDADGFKRQDMYRVNFSCPSMVADLMRHGFTFDKSLNYSYILEGEFQGAFLLGYFDGDGHVRAVSKNKHKKTHKGFMSLVGTEAFCHRVQSALGFGKVKPHVSKPVHYWYTNNRTEILYFYLNAYRASKTTLGLARKRKVVELLANEVL